MRLGGAPDPVPAPSRKPLPIDPEDETAEDEGTHDALSYTVDAIDAAGFYVDTELWPTAHAGKCSQCHAGCTSSPA